MRTWRNLVILVAPLLLIGCFFLPSTVSGITDAKNLGNLIVIESQSVSFESDASLNLPERLALAASPNTESLHLKNGRFLDADSALSRTISELIRFFGESAFEFGFEDSVVEDCTPAFIIDSDDPSVSLIVWMSSLIDMDGRRIDVTIDDETGAILSMLYVNLIYKPGTEPRIYAYDGMVDDSLLTVAETLADLMTDYYGLPVSLEDYMLSDGLAYYRADMFAGNIVLPLYGVVRESVFSINE